MSKLRPLRFLAVLAVTPLLSGCIASTAASLVTAPVRIVSQGADWATTSQSESDRNRGRDLRHREERYGKLERSYRRNTEKCDDGERDACREARSQYEEMQDLRASIPSDRDWRD